MKVLLISAARLAASPAGPATIAGAARAAGHTVEVFDCLFAQDVEADLEAHLRRFQPEVIGISIRFVQAIQRQAGCPGRLHQDQRAGVRQVVDCIRRVTGAPVILGGPGFNYFGPQWLEYLDLDYGIRGEADLAFPLALRRIEQHGDLSTVPGAVYRRDGQVIENPRHWVEDLDSTAYPAYDLFDMAQYAARGEKPSIVTKRGCAFQCTYCPYSALEGTAYRLKSPHRVADEVAHVCATTGVSRFSFCDNLFNAPAAHAAAICRELAARRLDARWGAEFTPLGMTPEFCALLRQAGCAWVNLDVESGSAAMLAHMHRGYTPEAVRAAVTNLRAAGIPFSIDLLLGTPGETAATLAETWSLLDSLPAPDSLFVTVGLALWTPLQAALATVRQEGRLLDDSRLFEGAYYLSSGLTPADVSQLIETLTARQATWWAVDALFGSS